MTFLDGHHYTFLMAEAFFDSVISELSFIVRNATPACVLIAVLTIAKQSIFGILYLPVKVLAVMKMLLLDVPNEGVPYVEIITNMFACFLTFEIYSVLEKDLIIFDSEEKLKYETLYKFILNFIKAMGIDFVARVVRLLIDALHKLLYAPKED